MALLISREQRPSADAAENQRGCDSNLAATFHTKRASPACFTCGPQGKVGTVVFEYLQERGGGIDGCFHGARQILLNAQDDFTELFSQTSETMFD